jgi:hypothetical protein
MKTMRLQVWGIEGLYLLLIANRPNDRNSRQFPWTPIDGAGTFGPLRIGGGRIVAALVAREDSVAATHIHATGEEPH